MVFSHTLRMATHMFYSTDVTNELVQTLSQSKAFPPQDILKFHPPISMDDKAHHGSQTEYRFIIFK